MLYTGKGDNGTTKLFNCPSGKRISKDNFIFETLGTLDELNSSLGYAKVLSRKTKTKCSIKSKKVSYSEIIEEFQQCLFSIQAQLGGAKIHLNSEHILRLEEIIQEIDKALPPIKSFVVSGGGETSAYLDICRTIARRAERDFVILSKKKKIAFAKESMSYLNRLSSALYALARFANYQEGYLENSPNYKK